MSFGVSFLSHNDNNNNRNLSTQAKSHFKGIVWQFGKYANVLSHVGLSNMKLQPGAN